MSHTRKHGLTLPEILVSMLIIGLTFFVIINIAVKAYKLQARTSVRIEPQASAMLAFKRMEREIRQAMLISTTTPMPSTWIEVIMPQKDSQGLNVLATDVNGRLALLQGETVRYFLGNKLQTQDANKKRWLARPSVNGTTLFRTTEAYNVTADTFSDCRILIDNIVNPSDASLAGDQQLARDALSNTLFVFMPYNDNGTPDDYTDDKPLPTTNLITITLVVKSNYQGKPVYHPLWTKFCLRNLI